MCQMRNQRANKPAIHRFHRALVKTGVDVGPLYARLRIDPATMTSEDTSLPMASYFTLLDLASRSSKIRFLSAGMAPNYDRNDMGILVYLIRNASNFKHALDILRRYVTLVSPGAEITLTEGETHYRLTYGFPGTPADKTYQDVEGTIVQFVIMIRELLDNDRWEPDQMYFAHAAINPDDPDKFPVGKSIVFQHPFSGVSFPKDIIEYPIKDADPNLLAILEAQVLQSTSELMLKESLLGRVRLLISSGLGNASRTSDDVAHALGMSRRTLHRRLQEDGTSYNALREEVVLEMAKTSLVSSSAPITHIALELGYADASAFNRAFKRLAGLSPLKYRKAHSNRQAVS
jgi:AraC-like DNA-binding protein